MSYDFNSEFDVNEFLYAGWLSTNMFRCRKTEEAIYLVSQDPLKYLMNPLYLHTPKYETSFSKIGSEDPFSILIRHGDFYSLAKMLRVSFDSIDNGNEIFEFFKSKKYSIIINAISSGAIRSIDDLHKLEFSFASSVGLRYLYENMAIKDEAGNGLAYYICKSYSEGFIEGDVVEYLLWCEARAKSLFSVVNGNMTAIEVMFSNLDVFRDCIVLCSRLGMKLTENVNGKTILDSLRDGLKGGEISFKYYESICMNCLIVNFFNGSECEAICYKIAHGGIDKLLDKLSEINRIGIKSKIKLAIDELMQSTFIGGIAEKILDNTREEIKESISRFLFNLYPGEYVFDLAVKKKIDILSNILSGRHKRALESLGDLTSLIKNSSDKLSFYKFSSHVKKYYELVSCYSSPIDLNLFEAPECAKYLKASREGSLYQSRNLVIFIDNYAYVRPIIKSSKIGRVYSLESAIQSKPDSGKKTTKISNSHEPGI